MQLNAQTITYFRPTVYRLGNGGRIVPFFYFFRSSFFPMMENAHAEARLWKSDAAGAAVVVAQLWRQSFEPFASD